MQESEKIFLENLRPMLHNVEDELVLIPLGLVLQTGCFVEAFPFSQNLPRNPSASLGIGQGVMMVDKVESAGRRHGVQLVIGQYLSKVFSRSPTSTIELIIRVIHLIDAHHGLQATLVERAIVRHQRQALNERLDLSPDVWKHGRVLGVLLGDAMHERVPIQIIIRLWLNERIERVHKLAVANNHHADATHAAALVIGGLEVYGGEGVQFLMCLLIWFLNVTDLSLF